MPIIRKSYIDTDKTGFAVYDFIEPYVDQTANIPYNIDQYKQDITTTELTKSLSQDPIAKLLWEGKPDALPNGQVALTEFKSAKLWKGDVSGLNIDIATFLPARPDTLSLGLDVQYLSGEMSVATATDVTNTGQVYILQHSTKLVSQIFSGSTAGAYFGSAVKCTADGLFIAIGETLPAASGNVYIYKQFTANSTVTEYVATGSGSSTYSLGFIPESLYSIRVIVNNKLYIAGVDYTVSGGSITFINSVSGLSISVKQLGVYYALIQSIDDPAASPGVGCNFGQLISLNADASILTVSAPLRGNGQIYVFNRSLQKFLITTPSTVLTLGDSVSTFGKVIVKRNGIVTTNYTPVAPGNTTITFPSGQLVTNTIIEVDMLKFYLQQTITVDNSNIQFGLSTDMINNSFVVGSPLNNITVENVIKNSMGIIELMLLDSDVNQTVSILRSTFTLSSAKYLRINNWVVAMDTNIDTFIANINSISNLSGVTASYTATDLIFTFNQSMFVNGVSVINYDPTTYTINSKFISIQTIQNSNLHNSNFGKKVKWLNYDLLGVIEDTTEYLDAATMMTDIQFDNNTTNIYDSNIVNTQRIILFQLLKTTRTNTSMDSDISQLVIVKSIQYSTESVDLFFDGNLERIWIGNKNSTAENNNVIVYSNTKLIHGWTIIRTEEIKLEPRSISRAWIYNSRTKTKIVDLDIVDIANGLLPGAIAQHIDYISGVDPTSYGIQNWRSGENYQIGDRVLYNGIVYVADVASSELYFDVNQWFVNLESSATSNSSNNSWGSSQVGQIWFSTGRLRTTLYEQGTLEDRLKYWNKWFTKSTFRVYEWSESSVPPWQYTGSGIVSPTSNYIFDSNSNNYYFWILYKTEVGRKHSISSADVSVGLRDILNSGLPMIVGSESNSVILWNVKELVDSSESVLHIDYVLTEHNNRLLSEFALVSENGSRYWFNTPLYAKLVDSLSGIDDAGLAVPDISLNEEDKYGTLNQLRQAMFRNQTTALKIYFDKINAGLLLKPLNNFAALENLKLKQEQPDVSTYDLTVEDKDTLLLLTTDDYPNGTKILVLNDVSVTDSGWGLYELINGTWELLTSQFYDLNVFWKYVDWSDQNNTGKKIDYILPHIGYLQSISPAAGDIMQIDNDGNNQIVIYKFNDDLSYDPIFIENGTVQFLPTLYDFTSSMIGFNAGIFGGEIGFDNDPATSLRLIIKALNEDILIDDLSILADNAFFAILRYILQENINIDWLFKTSFIDVNHIVKDLNIKSNYRKDDEQFVMDFINENKPYHTRIKDFNSIYTLSDVSNITVSDFDLPALYDTVWYAAQFNPTYRSFKSKQAGYFKGDIALVEKDGLLYIGTTSIASHPMGLWPNTTDTVVPANWVFVLPIRPTQAVSNTSVLVDNVIGIATNGVAFYSVVANETDTLTWSQDDTVSETYTVNIGAASSYAGPDFGNGYLTNSDNYVYRMDPTLLYSKGNFDSHSPIIGFALDGYPIYGPFGFKNSNGSGGVIQNTSSYVIKSMKRLVRHEPIVGMPGAEYGKPTGEYIEDYEYIPNQGTLDEHNGRFVVTPEFPYGIYAYFATVDTATKTIPVYPYLVGPTFHGIPGDLKVEYRGAYQVEVYGLDNYVLPKSELTPSTNWPLRSPNGTFYNDQARFLETPYSQWYNNRTFTIDTTSLRIADVGMGYTVAPTVIIDGGNQIAGGIPAKATATIDSNTGQLLSVVVTQIGTGYTLEPTVIGDNNIPAPVVTLEGGLPILTYSSTTTYELADIVFNTPTGEYFQALQTVPAGILLSNTAYWYKLNPDENVISRAAIVVADFHNSTTRKFDVNLKFDRTDSSIPLYNSSSTYYTDDIIVYGNDFYKALSFIPNYVLPTNTDYWMVLNSEDNVISRLDNFYTPAVNMISNDVNRLMVGSESAAVQVIGGTFAEIYTIPTGNLYDQEDDNIGDVKLHMSFDKSRYTLNVFSTKQKIFGSQSANFNDCYIQIDTNTVETLPDLATRDFTIEFFVRLKTINIAQTLVDLRQTVSDITGLIISVLPNNTIRVSDNNGVSFDGGAMSNNVWQHVVLERKVNKLSLYVDGLLVNSYQSNAYLTHSFVNNSLTFGASVDGSNQASAFMDEFRISVDLLRYDTSTFSVPSGGFGRNILEDPYFAHVIVLYGFEGFKNEVTNISFVAINAVNIFEELSTENNIIKVETLLPLDLPYTLTNIGDPLVGITTEGLYEVPSITLTDKLIINAQSNTAFNVGTGDFAIECWINSSSTKSTQRIFTLGKVLDSSLNDSLDLNISKNALVCYLTYNGHYSISLQQHTEVGDITIASTPSITSGPIPLVDVSLMFLSIERKDNFIYVYVDGTLMNRVKSLDSYGEPGMSVPLYFSSYSTDSFLGQLADIRFTVGSARHAAQLNIDTEISSSFEDISLGTGAADIIVNGSNFVDSVMCPSTEEHISGRIYDTLDISVYSQYTGGTEWLSFRIFKDMNENVSYYAIPAAETTQLSKDLILGENIIYLIDVSGFIDADPENNILGAIFVNGERITYLTVDRINNTLSNITRGTLGTYTPDIHAITSRVESMHESLLLPGIKGTLLPKTDAVSGNIENSNVFVTTNYSMTTAKLLFNYILQADVIANNTIILDSVKGLQYDYTVTGTGIVGLVKIISINELTNTVVLDSNQTIYKSTVITIKALDARVRIEDYNIDFSVAEDIINQNTATLLKNTDDLRLVVGMTVVGLGVATNTTVVGHSTGQVTFNKIQTLPVNTVLTFTLPAVDDTIIAINDYNFLTSENHSVIDGSKITYGEVISTGILPNTSIKIDTIEAHYEFWYDAMGSNDTLILSSTPVALFLKAHMGLAI